MIKVAFQGEKGAYSEIAALKYFGKKVLFSPSLTFNEVFDKIRRGTVQYGIVPIENSLYGSVYETYDLLIKYSFQIIGECNLQIRHNLLAKKKIELDEIKEIYSHPQALGQCSEFLKRMSKSKIFPSYDTAGSAKIINTSELNYAIIASKEAAAIYNLKILRRDIQNDVYNFTRFLILGKLSDKKKFNKPKSSICFELKSIPGALFKALSVFALRDIDLLKIESRPIPHKPFQYLFYIDFKGELKDTRIKQAINHLSEISISIKENGTYETGKIFYS
jgi:arogenate/prephenate dehydratase